jgi:hypothetical protein
MLFTSLLVCFVQLSHEELDPPESPLSRANCGLLSLAFFFQQLHSPSATEIYLLLPFQQLGSALASEISLVLLFSVAI